MLADGTLLVTLHAEENRENVRLAEIPLVMQQAVIAIEDERFYRHNGVDFRAILRAAERNADAGDIEQGGSTITQQYVKTAMIDDDSQTIGRKLEEATLALELERKYSKERILELYLNTVYFGNGAYGVQAVARQYFGKSITEISPVEAALLAGSDPGPSRTTRSTCPRPPSRGAKVVLDRMVANDMLEPDAAGLIGLGAAAGANRGHTGSAALPRRLLRRGGEAVGARRSAVRRHHVERRDLLFGGGLRIHTTVDLGMQAKAETAVAATFPTRLDRTRRSPRWRQEPGSCERWSAAATPSPRASTRSSTSRPKGAARQARRSSRSCSPPRSSTACRSPTATPRW